MRKENGFMKRTASVIVSLAMILALFGSMGVEAKAKEQYEIVKIETPATWNEAVQIGQELNNNTDKTLDEKILIAQELSKTIKDSKYAIICGYSVDSTGNIIRGYLRNNDAIGFNMSQTAFDSYKSFSFYVLKKAVSPTTGAK